MHYFCCVTRNPLPTWRNGSNPKTVATDSGKVLPGIPRHRNGCFDPIPIAKDRRRLPEVEDRNLAAKYPAPNWRRTLSGGFPFLDDPP